MSLESSYTEFMSQVFPIANRMLIAPFWDDSNNEDEGQIYYRLSTDQSLIDQVSTQIGDAFEVNFIPQSVFVTTWYTLPNFFRMLFMVS